MGIKSSFHMSGGRCLFLAFNMLLCLFVLIQCSPTSSNSQGSGRSRNSGQQAGNDQNQAGITGNQGSCSGENCGADYQNMPLGELMLLEQERKNQDLAEEDELVLLDAINTELCRKLDEKRKNCPAIKRLIFDPTERSLQCDGETAEASTAPKIVVTIPDNKIGTFVLMANDIYKSSSFGPGTNEITFSSESGGEFQAPQFIKVYKLALRSYDAAGKLKELPSIEAFNVKITIDGNELLNDYATLSEDTLLKEQNKEFRVPVNDIIELRRSSTCLVDQNQIDTLRSQIGQAITANQVHARKEDYRKTKESLDYNVSNPAAKRSTLIESVYGYQASIERRFPILEAERNRQFKLISEIKTDVQIGCQYIQPIHSFELEIEGNMNMNVALGTEDGQRPPDLQDGPASELLLDFGGVKFSVDFSTQNIFGIRYPLEKDVSDEAIIGELDRIYLRKKGATFNNVAVSCNNTGGILGQLGKVFYDETCYEVYEDGVFSIDAISIYVNGKKAFSRSDLGISLDHKSRKWTGDLQSNEKWIQLMLDDTCEATN